MATFADAFFFGAQNWMVHFFVVAIFQRARRASSAEEK